MTTIEPLLSFSVISTGYTETWKDVRPTQIPLIKRSDNQHTYPVTACLYSGSKQPPKADKGDGITTSDAAGYRTSHYDINHGASNEGSTDVTLSNVGRIIKVVHILLHFDRGGDE